MPPHNANETVLQHTNGGTDANQNGGTKQIEKMKPEPPTATVVVPPDGGWGWVVMIASFCCCLIVDGIVMSAGMFKEELEKEFGASKSSVALVCSLLGGFYLIAGPFVSALANKWGFRPVTIIGSVIAAAAFGASYFATGIIYLYIVYGVIGGIGFCMIYIPAVLTVGYYFERWRALATGIAMCGSGVGTFIFAPLTSVLIERVGWRGTLAVQAALILSCCLMGLIFRPLKPIQVTIDDDFEEKEKMLPIIFTKPLPEGRFAYSVPNSVHNTWIGASSNTHYPTAAEVFRGSGANMDRVGGDALTAANAGSREGRRPSGTSSVLNSTNMKKLEQLSKAQRRASGQTTPEDTFPAPVFTNVHKELVTVGEAEEEENENETLIEEGMKPVQMMERRHTVSGRRPILPNSKGGRSRSGATGDNRPMYRDDIFFSGSLVRIPKYQSQSSLGYHMSVTRLPNKNDVEEVGLNQIVVYWFADIKETFYFCRVG